MKKLQKILAVLLALMMVFAFVGCGGDDQTADDQTDDQATEEQADESGDAEPQVSGDFPESVYVSLDGTPVRPGTNFDDVKDAIGTEIADPVTNEPCDPAMEGPETDYFY